jgi:hypothetical protein
MLSKTITPLAGLALGLALLACQSDVTDPTQIELTEEYDSQNPEEWEYPAIYGYCRDDGDPIYMAKVTWRCGEDVLGYCITRMDGWYRISDLTDTYDWQSYAGEDLDGDATHSLYEITYENIQGYDYPEDYRRDFSMEPDPGHGTLATNGMIQGRVKKADNGEYIYPACVTVYGDDMKFLGYDTT